MALRVSVVSEHAVRLADQASKVFGVHGGSIGRAHDNEWILPDPERYLSGKHARIECRAGRYYLVDTSSNGTYVNGAPVPLGRFHEYPLQDGDYVRIGEYELRVSVDPSNDFPPDDSAIVAFDGASPPASVHKATANDIGADLDLSELLEPGGRLDSHLASVARDAYGQPILSEPPPPRPAEAAEPVPWHMMTRPLTLERAAAPGPHAPALYDADGEPGLAAFCRGAGIDPRRLSPESRVIAMQLAGQILRECVLGLTELDQSRAEFRDRLQLPPDEHREDAIRFGQGVEETLFTLLTTSAKRGGSVESVRERFQRLKAENGATAGALHGALEDFLGRFDPRELEERFERDGKRGVFTTQNNARYWELYRDLYTGLSQRAADGLPHWFAEAFAKTYADTLGRLLPRRGAFGEATGTD